MKHARLSASGSKRWIECPDSPNAEQAAGDVPSSIFGLQGTGAHSLADLCLKDPGQDLLATDFVGAVVLVKDGHETEIVPAKYAEGKRVERLVAEGWSKFTVSEEEGYGDTDTIQAWAVNMFIEWVRLQHQKFADIGAELVTEVYLDMTWLHELMGGTADANFMGIDGYIKLFDLKYGSGVMVEVQGNTQLRIYALGILHLNPGAYGVDMFIVQPRMEHADGPIRHVRYTREQLLQFQDEIKVAADLTQSPVAHRKAGTHCGWCKAIHTCDTFRQETRARAMMEFDFDGPVDVIRPPTNTADLARLAEWIPMLDALSKAVDGAISRELHQGREVRGWKLVRGKTNRKYGRPADHPDGLWEKGDAVPEEEIVELLKAEALLSEAEMFAPRKMLSLAQMEKLGKDAKKAILQVTFKPEGPLTVAPESDKREAVKVEVAEFPDDDVELLT